MAVVVMMMFVIITTVIAAAAPLVVTTAYAQLPPPQSQNMTNNTAITNNTTTIANATSLNATTTAANATTNATTTRIITNLTWWGSDLVEQLSPQNIQYQQTDPAFAKLAQITADCLNDYNAIFERLEAAGGGTQLLTAEDIRGQDLCTDVIRQGVNQFCESTDFVTFDIQKCEEAHKITDTYLGIVERVFG